jgi:hypothetical protein
MFLRRISPRKFNPRTPMAAVVCRTGTKALTEFSTEKLHIKKIFQHIIGTGEIKRSILIVFVAAGLPCNMGKSSKKGSFLLKCPVKSEGSRQDSTWTDHNSLNNYF